MARRERRPAFTFAALFLIALLAGCAGSNEAPPADLGLDAQDFGQGTGTLQGQVVNEEEIPILGAQVVIGDLPPVRTDEAGLFRAVGLPIATLDVTVTADGHTSASKSVTLREGVIEEVSFQIERLPALRPYVEVLNFVGYSYCDYMLIWSHGRLGQVCGSDIGENNTIFRVNVSSTWQFMVSEIDWQPVFGGTSDSMRLVHGPHEGCSSGDPCYGVEYGTYYARLEGEPGKTELVTHYDPYTDGRGPPYPNGTFDLTVVAQWAGFLREELRTPDPVDYCQIVVGLLLGGGEYKPGCLGVGVSPGISFDLWVSIFHNHLPADYGECCPATEYTALPDN